MTMRGATRHVRAVNASTHTRVGMVSLTYSADSLALTSSSSSSSTDSIVCLHDLDVVSQRRPLRARACMRLFTDDSR